jgi:hypothetical protein
MSASTIDPSESGPEEIWIVISPIVRIIGEGRSEHPWVLEVEVLLWEGPRYVFWTLRCIFWRIQRKFGPLDPLCSEYLRGMMVKVTMKTLERRHSDAEYFEE